MNGLCVGALSYADDITLISPSIRGLNKMMDICAQFADDYCITFNSTKTVCIKFGDKVNNHEKVYLKDKEIVWVEKIRHLGNFLNTTLTDEVDCKMKISSFIGNVNKLNANFGQLQHIVLSRLFKTHCCSYYGSQLWRLNSMYFDRVCTEWNKSVRRLFNLPYTTHTWMLGPLLHQFHIRHQLQKRTIRFLHVMSNSSNRIVQTCYEYASNNANSPLGCNLAYIRNCYGFNISDQAINICLKLARPTKLTTLQEFIIKELETLILSREGQFYIDGFSANDIELMIHIIATQ